MKNIKKKLFGVILTAVLVLSVFGGSMTVAHAEETGVYFLSHKEYNTYLIGEENVIRLQVFGNTDYQGHWSVKSKKIADLFYKTPDGVGEFCDFEIKKNGTTYAVCKIDGQELKCKIVVDSKNKPENLKKNVTVTTIKLLANNLVKFTVTNENDVPVLLRIPTKFKDKYGDVVFNDSLSVSVGAETKKTFYVVRDMLSYYPTVSKASYSKKDITVEVCNGYLDPKLFKTTVKFEESFNDYLNISLKTKYNSIGNFNATGAVVIKDKKGNIVDAWSLSASGRSLEKGTTVNGSNFKRISKGDKVYKPDELKYTVYINDANGGWTY